MSWPPAGHNRQRELFSTDEAEPCEPPAPDTCDDHVVDNWRLASGDPDGCELEAHCRRCGQYVYKYVDASDLLPIGEVRP